MKMSRDGKVTRKWLEINRRQKTNDKGWANDRKTMRTTTKWKEKKKLNDKMMGKQWGMVVKWQWKSWILIGEYGGALITTPMDIGGGKINSINGGQLEAWCLCMGRDVAEHQKDIKHTKKQ